MGKIDERLDAMGAQLVGINQRLDRMDAYPRRWLYVGLLLGVLLIVAQVGTPFLTISPHTWGWAVRVGSAFHGEGDFPTHAGAAVTLVHIG